MKRFNKNSFPLYLMLGAALSLLLSSCLKNNGYYNDFSTIKQSVELPLAANYTNNPFALALDVSDEPTDYPVYVNVAGLNKATSAVTATLALDIDYLNDFNAQKLAADSTFKPYELLPDSTYQLGGLDITVSPNQRLGSTHVKLFTSKIAGGHKYVLPFTIKTASLPISNWNHLLINLTTRNKYDGKWTNTYDGSLGAGKNTITLTTMDGNNSQGDKLIGVYSNETYYYIDPVTNAASIDIPSLAPVVMDPSSHYDPDTKTIYLDYKCGAGGKYHITQTMVKQ